MVGRQKMKANELSTNSRITLDPDKNVHLHGDDGDGEASKSGGFRCKLESGR